MQARSGEIAGGASGVWLRMELAEAHGVDLTLRLDFRYGRARTVGVEPCTSRWTVSGASRCADRLDQEPMEVRYRRSASLVLLLIMGPRHGCDHGVHQTRRPRSGACARPLHV